ncbi:MAG: phosphatidate cytidylyltransferase [Deltaproteobacteria bacterium]|nr:phosphatidate cytidylyltransferase [Deltaproteobacteria bacterium]
MRTPPYDASGEKRVLKRLATAALLIPPSVYIILYASTFWVFAIVGLITILSLLEFNRLTGLKTRDHGLDILLILVAIALFLSVYRYGHAGALPVVAGSTFIFLAECVLARRDIKDSFFDAALKTLGVVYIALPLSYFLVLKDIPDGRWWMLFLFVTIWSNDTSAYLAGKTVGQTKLCPEISPNKTIEGLVGGLAGGAAAAAAFNWYFRMGLPGGEVVFVALFIGGVGVFGDLFESLIKRASGVKDSGAVIPGHGGMLDRIDSVIFAAPALYYYMIWFHPAGS